MHGGALAPASDPTAPPSEESSEREEADRAPAIAARGSDSDSSAKGEVSTNNPAAVSERAAALAPASDPPNEESSEEANAGHRP